VLNYSVNQIKAEETHEWILKIHYAKRLPSISWAFGLYFFKDLVGIITFGMPASNQLCFGVCGKEYKSNVLELNRLCLLNNKKNEASFLISNSIKLLPKPSIIVSYADKGQNHTGCVYQATNFLFTGTTKERTDAFAGEGKHSRHATDSTIRQHRTAKHRYVYIHADKKGKKDITKKLNYDVFPYPKGDKINYKTDYNPITQIKLI
jgi:hypothetical protein